ncbi:hypothetical protein AGABI1DRAFT_59094 [Agaricus bisporus var. burnettii JB137-S8]|uniref:Ras GEF n=1 Tax=Agaricus bisporus var. burnettii (strain JB137-S8 / ATCC MYA-4627 / FGSC 10392) TaxID=597362 RepID=K5X8A8_AGABU|nr:uncharacterized protein AGABI1DRAFT_59094 [Agaricus bisporus var. burnettii JB137-S8]EKM79458.1 hypothetical protein AGABI1DRAFT_59094 [Agaricus bisporus var. burnettii JB137-S8]
MESEYAMAMHDYEPQQSSTTCLSFRAGQVIHVFNRDPSGWWDGELEGKRGWFPSNYVNVEFGKSSIAVVQAALNAQSKNGSPTVASTTSQHRRQSAVDAFPTDAIHYSAPIMIPMVHGLSLLQNAVRVNRVSHFQPSAACIIACVRRILNTTETINRDAPILRRFPTLAQERSRLLTILAKLVAQAKRASDASLSENELAEEIVEMLKTGGVVFSQVRRFVAVAVQCGIELPENGGMEPPSPTESLTGSSWQDEGEEEPSPRGVTPTQRQWKKSSVSSSSQTSMRAKSLMDLRNGPSCVQPPINSLLSRTTRARAEQAANARECEVSRHKVESSISSTSSSSSSSSQGYLAVKSPPPFPSGPTTSLQVLDALRFTHDQYLSTIAAFIGHTHSYSRSSHASSTGHLYELTRDIVRMVERILTIVVAVMSHPDIPTNRANNLRSANEALYTVASQLTDSIRQLTVPLAPLISEEEEKAALIRSATGALKAGSDCVAAVKVCLNRVAGEKAFILDLPSLDGEEPQLQLQSNQTLSSGNSHKPTGMSAPLENRSTQDIPEEEEEEVTVHPGPSTSVLKRSRELSFSSETSGTSKTCYTESVDTVATSPTDYRPNPLLLSGGAVEPDILSPVSLKSADDGKTTWEGSTRMHDNTAIGEKMLFGELPQAPLGFDQDPENWMYSHDYSLEDVAYNSEGILVGATLEALVEKMTPHDVVVDPAFSVVFFMTFRLFTSPTDLVDAIIARYNLVPPHNGLSSEELHLWQRKKGLPVRLRVSNLIRQWVELYWKPGVDDPILPTLMTFTREGLWNLFPAPAQRLFELLEMRKHEMDMGGAKAKNSPLNKTLLVPSTSGPTSEIPRPNMTKALLMSLRKKDYSNVCITDFDALELARQITVMECTLYCAIQPEEILEAGQQDGAKARSNTNVKAVSSLSTVITGWVAESILDERDLKRRTLLIKFFIKVADRCTSLYNYSTSRSILAALDSSTIARLHQTWASVPHKSKTQLESLRKLADHGRNYHEYRSRLRNTCPPAVPFLGLYLTDVTFCREGNPSHRVSPLNSDKKLLNFNKYHKLARIVQDMQRFQVPYNLKAIPEVQDYLNMSFENSKRSGDFQDLYRRSLLVEPKQPADTAHTSDMRQLFNWAMRSQSVAPAS